MVFRATHRRARASVAALVVVLTAVDGFASPVRAARPRRPDIILIVTDDQRHGTIRWLPTANRYVSAHGVRFSRAMVSTSLCCPSRSSLLTGEYSHTTKVWSNKEGWRRFVGAGMHWRSVALWLRRSGYRTGLVGKYLNAYHGKAPPPGWTAWHAFVGWNADYYDYGLQHTGGAITRYGADPGSYSTDVLRRFALGFIRHTPSRTPFFLYFSPYAPHWPATPAPRHVGLPARLARWGPPSFFEEDLGDKPLWIQQLPRISLGDIQELRAEEYRALRSVDEAIDAILSVQRARGRLRNTLLIVVSDNAVMWGEHRVVGKFVPYAGATRIPLAIAWPARIPGGRIDARLALNIDVPVTIAAAAEAPHPDVVGRSLLGRWRRVGFVLEAGASRVPGGNGTNVERPAYCGWRTARFLFVRYANGREELYDYAKDPWELQDRRGTNRDLQSFLREKAREACRPVPPGFSW